MKLMLSALMISALAFSSMPAVAGKYERMMASDSGTKSLEDTVKKLRDDDEGVVVLFVNTKGNYYLRRESNDFDADHEKLKASLNEKKPVSVIVETDSLNIVEVK